MKLLKQPGDHTDTSVVVGQRLFRLHPRAPSQVDHLEVEDTEQGHGGDCGGGGNGDPDQAPVSPPDRSASRSIPLCDHSHQT